MTSIPGFRAELERLNTDLQHAEVSRDPEELSRIAHALARVARLADERADELHEKLRIDSLTLLPSREAYEEDIAPELMKFYDGENDRRRYPANYIIIIADLDGLHTINNEDGHLAGDDAIRKSATVLKQSIRTNDWVGRRGDNADEFMVVVRISDDDDVEKSRVAILERVAELSKEYGIGISLGAAIASDYLSLNECLDDADKAMYQDKIFHYSQRGIVYSQTKI